MTMRKHLAALGPALLLAACLAAPGAWAEGGDGPDFRAAATRAEGARAGTGTRVQHETSNKTQTGTRKKKQAHGSVTATRNGVRVGTGGANGSVSVGPRGPRLSVRPGGGPVRVGIGANGRLGIGLSLNAWQ